MDRNNRRTESQVERTDKSDTAQQKHIVTGKQLKSVSVRTQSVRTAEKPTASGSCDCPAPEKTCGGFVEGTIQTKTGSISRVSTVLTLCDKWGGCKARWGIDRMNYKVTPGLYCVGKVTVDSPVLVTANYKLTFDALRKELGGLSAYILVLDTKGINVWCASGKGTFGTNELVKRIKAAKLERIVSHRTVVLPQLGAVGVAAHEVLKRSGFRVLYGPVRACDVPAFLSRGMHATRDMRTVRFTARDRLVLTPIELTQAFKPISVVLCILFILNAVGLGTYGLVDLYALLGAFVVGTVLTPLLLPILPGRAFSFKGMLLGLFFAFGVNALNGWPLPYYGMLKALAYYLALPAVSAFAALNFTGCSTYTSLSGVNKEMKTAIPLILIAIGIGIVLLLADGIVHAIGADYIG